MGGWAFIGRTRHTLRKYKTRPCIQSSTDQFVQTAQSPIFTAQLPTWTPQVVLSASIPSQLRFTVVAKAPPAPASNGKPAAAAPPRPGAAANGLSVVVPGDAGSAGEAVAADGDADALEMKKKPCCVVM